MALWHHLQSFLFMADIRSAFPSADRPGLYILYDLSGVDGRYSRFRATTYFKSRVLFVLNGRLLRGPRMRNGQYQGSVLSIVDLLTCMEIVSRRIYHMALSDGLRFSCQLFADDLASRQTDFGGSMIVIKVFKTAKDLTGLELHAGKCWILTKTGELDEAHQRILLTYWTSRPRSGSRRSITAFVRASMSPRRTLSGGPWKNITPRFVCGAKGSGLNMKKLWDGIRISFHCLDTS